MKRQSLLRWLKRLVLLLLLASATTTTAILWFVIEGFGGSAILPADCAVVFGAAVRPVKNAQGHIIDSVAGPGIARRMETAISLYHNDQIDRVIVTGGMGDRMIKSEATVMRELAIDRGVRAEDIVAEDHAGSTWENLLLARPLTEGCTSVVGISDRYHLARIEFLAKHIGWNLPTVPAEKHSNFLFEARSVVREVLGILYYGFSRFLS